MTPIAELQGGESILVGRIEPLGVQVRFQAVADGLEVH